MKRWIVFNGFLTADGYPFHVYIDAEDAGTALELAIPAFKAMAKVVAFAPPTFADREGMQVVRVSP